MTHPLKPLQQRADTTLAHINEQDTFDLAVIGSGGAGLSAALNAALDGA